MKLIDKQFPARQSSEDRAGCKALHEAKEVDG